MPARGIGDAEELLIRLEDRSAKEYISPHYIGEIHLALGRFEKACNWFERAANEHTPLIIVLAVPNTTHLSVKNPAFGRFRRK